MGLEAIEQEMGAQPHEEREPSIGRMKRVRGQGESNTYGMKGKLVWVYDLFNRMSPLETNFNSRFYHMDTCLDNL